MQTAPTSVGKPVNELGRRYRRHDHFGGHWFVNFALLLLFSVTALSMCTAVGVLSNLGGPTPDIRMEDLEVGNLLPMFFGGTFRRAFPTFPSDFQAMLSLWCGIYVATLAIVSRLIVGPIFRISTEQQAVFLFLLGLLPALFGRFYLAIQPGSPSSVGVWIHFMLLSPFYSSLMSGFLLFARKSAEPLQWWKLEAQLQQIDCE